MYRTVSPHVVALALAVAILLLIASVADAALTTGACLAQKRVAWGTLRKCQATEEAKGLRGKPADLARCQTKFQTALAKIAAKATKAVIACRYGDNGDGTVTDYDTGLMWEQKTQFGDLCPLILFGEVSHCVQDQYSFDNAVAFANRLNGVSADGTTLPNLFAGHADWRVPTIVEFRTIVNSSVPGCGNGAACIDPAFGPTVASSYWSATTNASNPSNAWDVNFSNGSVDDDFSKANSFYVRAVRAGL